MPCRWPAFPIRRSIRTWPRSSRRACARRSASRWRTRELAKGLVKRDVVRVVTPGTLTDDELLDPKTANYLAAVVEVGGQARPGLGRAVDRAVLADGPDADRAGRRDRPAQPGGDLDLRAEPRRPLGRSCSGASRSGAITVRPSWDFQPEQARKTLFEQFGTTTLAGFGVDDRRHRGPGRRRTGRLPARDPEDLAGPHHPADPLSPRRHAGPRRDDPAEPRAGPDPPRGEARGLAAPA